MPRSVASVVEAIPLRVRRDHPDRRVPLAHRQLRILKDRPDLDRELLATGVALVLLPVLVSVPIRALVSVAAQRAELPVRPTHRRQVINRRLLGREGREHLGDQGFELTASRLGSYEGEYALISTVGSSTYIVPDQIAPVLGRH
jgi:hypothetical protein